MIRGLAAAALVAFLLWLFLLWMLLLPVSVLLAAASYILLRVDVARNPIYREARPPPRDDEVVIEDTVPTAAALGIPLGFTRHEARVRKSEEDADQ